MPIHNPIPKGLDSSATEATARAYNDLFDSKTGGGVKARKTDYMRMVNDFYNMATDFYEFGWGKSFHFASRRKGESFKNSIRRHEQYLATQLKLDPSMKAADIGCGVGGPMREIVRSCGVHVTGVNNNAYQLEKCERYCSQEGLEEKCSTLQSDFMNILVEDGTFDAAYAIEATVHAPDTVGVYSEIARILKKGSCFAAYEWSMTDDYDPDNAEHQEIKHDIERGNALPNLETTSSALAALEEAGFEVLEYHDRAVDSDPGFPWYRALQGKDLSLKSIPRTSIGQAITHSAVKIMEKVGVAPKGTTGVSEFLMTGAKALVKGGKAGVFTPMFYFLARKK